MEYLKGLGQVVFKVVKPILLPLAGAVALYTAQYFGLGPIAVPADPTPIVEPAK